MMPRSRELSTRKVSPSWVRFKLVDTLEEPGSREVQPLIELARIGPHRRERARRHTHPRTPPEQDGDLFLEIAHPSRSKFRSPSASSEDSFPLPGPDFRLSRRVCSMDSFLVADRKSSPGKDFRQRVEKAHKCRLERPRFSQLSQTALARF